MRELPFITRTNLILAAITLGGIAVLATTFHRLAREENGNWVLELGKRYRVRGYVRFPASQNLSADALGFKTALTAAGWQEVKVTEVPPDRIDVDAVTSTVVGQNHLVPREGIDLGGVRFVYTSVEEIRR